MFHFQRNFITRSNWWVLRGVWGSKSLQVSMTLLSIPADHNNVMDLIYRFFLWFPILYSSFPAFWNFSTCPHHNRYYRHPHFPQLFQVSRKVRVCILLFSFKFSPWLAVTAKSTSGQVLFWFFINTRSCYLVNNQVIHFYPKITENSMRLIYLNGFWFVHLAFVCMVAP